MLRSFITLVFITCISPVYASTFLGVDKNNTFCSPKGDYFLKDVEVIKSVNGNAEYTTDINPWEHEMWRAANAAANSATACLKDGLRKQNCKNIISSLNSWASENALEFPVYGKKSWSSSAYISNHVLISMLEAFAVANTRLKLSEEEKATAKNWFRDVLLRADKRKDGIVNNHRTVWVIAAAKYAAIFNDEEFKNEAAIELKRYFSSITDEGVMPYEANRGSRALFYTFRQASFLMALMDVAHHFDINAYSLYGQQLHQAVSFGLDAMADNMLIYPYAKQKVAAPNSSAKIQDYGLVYAEERGTFQFATLYVRKFPNHENSKRILGDKRFLPFLLEDRRTISGHGWDIDCFESPLEAQLEKALLSPDTCSEVLSFNMEDGRNIALTNCKTSRSSLTAQINRNSRAWNIASDLSVKNPTYGFATIKRDSETDLALAMYVEQKQQYSGIVEFDSQWCEFEFYDNGDKDSKISCDDSSDLIAKLNTVGSSDTSPVKTLQEVAKCKFEISNQFEDETWRMTGGTLHVLEDGKIKFGENEGFKLRGMSGQFQSLLGLLSELGFDKNSLSGQIVSFRNSKRTAEILQVNADTMLGTLYEGTFEFSYSDEEHIGRLIISECK